MRGNGAAVGCDSKQLANKHRAIILVDIRVMLCVIVASYTVVGDMTYRDEKLNVSLCSVCHGYFSRTKIFILY